MFSVGDVVELKSGGPSMTVVEVESSGHVIAQWFDDSDLRSGGFLPETLRRRDHGPSKLEIPNFGAV
jgi:uncharacterized protein YodC (DUF2158 family)